MSKTFHICKTCGSPAVITGEKNERGEFPCAPHPHPTEIGIACEGRTARNPQIWEMLEESGIAGEGPNLRRQREEEGKAQRRLLAERKFNH